MENFKNEQINPSQEKEIPEDFISDIKELQRDHENPEKIIKVLSHLQGKSDWHKEAIKKINTIDAIEILTNYAVKEPEVKKPDESTTPKRDKDLQNSITATLFSFIDETSEVVNKIVSHAFSKKMEDQSEVEKAIKTYSLLSSFLDLSLHNDIEGQAVSLIKTIQTIKLIIPEVARLENSVNNRGEFWFDNLIKSANELLLRIGDEEAVQKFIDEFIGKTKNECFLTSSFVQLFPKNEQYSFATKDLNKLWDSETDNSYENEITDAFKITQGLPIKKIQKEILEYWKLPESIEEKWKASNDTKKRAEWKLSNLEEIRNLENRKKGSTKKLFENNGICCFARYKEEMLLEQLEPVLENEPYGIMGTCYQDHNGAYSYQKKIYNKINEESKRLGMKMRIFEYDKKQNDDFFNKIEKVSSTEGEWEKPHKAKFIWINEHGQPLKEDEEKKKKIQSRWEYALGVGENRESLIIEDGGAVVVLMCSGGEKDNVADVLAKEYNISSTGPSITTVGVSDISFKENEGGKLSIDVTYRYKKDDPELQNAKTMKYDYSNEK